MDDRYDLNPTGATVMKKEVTFTFDRNITLSDLETLIVDVKELTRDISQVIRSMGVMSYGLPGSRTTEVTFEVGRDD